MFALVICGSRVGGEQPLWPGAKVKHQVGKTDEETNLGSITGLSRVEVV